MWVLFYSIKQLQTAVSFRIFGNPTFASRLRFSLNGKDELSGDSLFSMGLNSRDTIYYGFSQGNNVLSNLEHHECQNPRVYEIEQEKLEIKRFSEPYLLGRVLCEEMNYAYTPTKLVIAAVHAVFLESGCVGFDSVSGLRVNKLVDMLKEQAAMPVVRSVSYTLSDHNDNYNDRDSIVLKFLTSGIHLIVYGSLAKSHGSGLHKLDIDISKYFPAVSSLWATNDNPDSTALIAYAEKVKLVIELWKIVKDGLALPLLIDLCEKSGLDHLPPCLTRLPAGLKSRILEWLPGQDIAKMACVCREMKHLSDNDELWKEKYMSEFGTSSKKRKRGDLQLLEEEEETNWKARFASSREKRTKKREGGLLWTAYPYHVFGHPLAKLPKETGMLPPKYPVPSPISGIAPPPSKPYEVTPGMPKMNPINLGVQISTYEQRCIPRLGSDPSLTDRIPLPPVPPLPRIFGST